MIVELVLEVTQTLPVEMPIEDRQQIQHYHDYCEFDVTFAHLSAAHARYKKSRDGESVHICS